MVEATSAIDALNERVCNELLQSLLAMPFDEFEGLVGRLLQADGYKNVLTTRRGADGGIDLTAERTDRWRTERVKLQAKRQKGNVGVGVVRELRGCLEPGESGVVITTAGFTASAGEEAKARARVPISLIDGIQVVDMLVAHEIGVRKRHTTVLELVVNGSHDDRTPREPIATGETHDSLAYRSRHARTPSGRRIESGMASQFNESRAFLIPVFSSLAGAALRASAEADYFPLSGKIAFTAGPKREVVMMVQVQKARLAAYMRLPEDFPTSDRLHAHADRAWPLLRRKVYLTSPGDLDADMRLWLGLAFHGQRHG